MATDRETIEIRDELVEAFAAQLLHVKRDLIRRLERLQVTARGLAVSGLPHLFKDKTFRESLHTLDVVKVETMVGRWRRDFRDGEEHGSLPGRKLIAKPLAGLGADTFMVRVAELADWLRDAGQEHEEELALYRRLAARLVLRRLTSWRMLDSVLPDEIEEFGKSMVEKAVLRRAVEYATQKGGRKRSFSGTPVKAMTVSQVLTPGESPEMGQPSLVGAAVAPVNARGQSAFVLGENLSAEQVKQAEQYWDDKVEEAGMGRFGTLAPREAIRAAGRAVTEGVDVTSLMVGRAKMMQVEVVKKSLPSVASGLKAWHGFAVEVLKYEEDASLPPREGKHMVAYVSVFRCSGTAANYVGYVRWACKTFDLSLEWDTAEIKAVINGIKKRTVRQFGGRLPQKWLLTSSIVCQVVSLAKSLAPKQWQALCTLAWAFLLRVQSEGVELQFGSAKEVLDLPEGYHSALVVGESELILRLRARKHRPRGSVLRKRCECEVVGQTACALCFMKEYVKEVKPQPGDRVYGGSASEFSKTLRRMLVLLGIPGGELFTLKAYRAGRASEMARGGASWQALQAAGEWRGMSPLSYVAHAAIDDAAFLDTVVAASSDEEA